MSIIVLIYDTGSRTISKDVDGVVTEITATEAQAIFEKGEAADWTLSFYRLAMAEYDHDEVERQYKELDANRSESK